MTHWLDPYNGGDLRAMLAWVHPDVEFRPFLLGERTEVYRGRSGVSKWLLRARKLEPRRSLLVDEVRALAGGRFLAVGTTVFGAGVRTPFCALHEFRDGLLIKVQHWLTTPERLGRLGYID
jgi:SnoaL-like protein